MQLPASEMCINERNRKYVLKFSKKNLFLFKIKFFLSINFLVLVAITPFFLVVAVRLEFELKLCFVIREMRWNVSLSGVNGCEFIDEKYNNKDNENYWI